MISTPALALVQSAGSLLFSFLFNNSIMVAYELNYPFSLRNSLDTRKKGASLCLLTCSWHLVDFFVS